MKIDHLQEGGRQQERSGGAGGSRGDSRLTGGRGGGSAPEGRRAGGSRGGSGGIRGREARGKGSGEERKEGERRGEGLGWGWGALTGVSWRGSGGTDARGGERRARAWGLPGRAWGG